MDPRATQNSIEKAKSRIQLLDHQLKNTIPLGYGPQKQSAFRRGAVGLYTHLAPKGAIDSILARLIVGATNIAMDCFDRATLTKQEPAHSLNVQCGLKSAALVADLLEKYESRRESRTQSVAVANVNVEPGAQAIVGPIQSKERPPAARPRLLKLKKSNGTKATYRRATNHVE